MNSSPATSLSPADALLEGAIISHNLDDMQRAIAQGADINIRETDGTPLLIRCIKNRFSSGALLLLQNGANKNELDYSFSSGLIWAVIKRENAVAEYLIEKGCDFHQVDELGYTALCWAVANGDISLAHQLFEAGMSPNQQAGHEGRTPLMVAIESSQLDMALYLIERGADPAIENAKQRDAWYYGSPDFNLPLRAAMEARFIEQNLPKSTSAGSSLRL